MKRLLYIFSLWLLPLAAMAQGAASDTIVPFNGLVVDLLGNPVCGVKVYTIDRHYYTVSDRKGRFGLTNVLPSDTIHLVYKRVNYVVPVGNMKSAQIALGDQYDLQATESEELLNMGYSYVKRREMVGSSAVLSGEVLRRRGYTDILQALQGLVPGVIIQTNQQGQSEVCLRGVNTITGSTTPLFIVDDLVVPSFEMVSIYDVVSVEVMRDAFIYGSRGANGAILVRTKK